MKIETFHRGSQGKKYGIFNTQKKQFQFDICEDTPMLAQARLFQKIGEDAHKWRFEIKELPKKNQPKAKTRRSLPQTVSSPRDLKPGMLCILHIGLKCIIQPMQSGLMELVDARTGRLVMDTSMLDENLAYEADDLPNRTLNQRWDIDQVYSLIDDSPGNMIPVRITDLSLRKKIFDNGHLNDTESD